METSFSEHGTHLCYIRWLFGDAGVFNVAIPQDYWPWNRSREIF